ncbi:MAG: hypothetical protein IJU98_06680 [Synergistaceae bacterium]|nr:hypothetical protein [Synergistaceae bacterium]
MRKICVALLFALFCITGGASADSAANTPPEVDLDLTQFNDMMAYSGLFNIFMEPEAYVSKVIKLKGRFDCVEDETGRRFYGVLLSDASACCSAGLDFVLKDSYAYPRDYPKIGETVTVAGRFEMYNEGEDVFAHLVDADIL